MTRRSPLLPWFVSIALHGAVAGFLLSTERPRPSHPAQRVEIAVLTPQPKTPVPVPVPRPVPVPVPVPVPIQTPGPGPGPGPGPDHKKSPKKTEIPTADPNTQTAPSATTESPPLRTPETAAKGSVTIPRNNLRRTEHGDPLAPKLDPEKPLESSPTIRVHKSERLSRLRSNGDGTYSYSDRGFTAEIARDGTVTFDGRSNIQPGGGRGVASFDITEAVMAANNEDPFRYEKKRFLEETRALREAMCDADRKEKLENSVFELKSRLKRIWADKTISSKKRREIIFQLWDECAEPNEEVTTDVARTAEMARATVLAFIQQNLPEGSDDAYQPEELIALNDRRASKQKFAPYP